jgi:deoxyribodipyrimidine photolyase-related protein
MKVLRLVLGDQLSGALSSLRDIDRAHDIVLMAEVQEETTYVRHHKQKLVLILSAMRHFAEALENDGISVDYIRLDGKGNTGSLTGELERAIKRHKPDRIVVTEPGEWRLHEMMETWNDQLGTPVEIREDDRFLCSRAEFSDWAKGRKSYRMEFFYRHMRRKTGWLMDGKKPEGGRWNYDAENRESVPADLAIPKPRRFTPDEVTRDVMTLVEERFDDHFGKLDSFGWAVTRKDALKALKYFTSKRLSDFGDYQDAMKTGEDFLFHSVLSPYMNIGLLSPREVCEAALRTYGREGVPLHSIEGFVRQIIGWREYVRGIYWLKMPGYAKSNFLKADRPLPNLYWTGETDMRCIRETIQSTRRNAYAHHIQRLMVTGNFALLAGLKPPEVEEWYLIVYADAFDWVELPNTHGMVLHADGGLLGSKPYAASAAYINRMSDYCDGCDYKPGVKLGPGACPFNYLYWNFMMANEGKLRKNPRMAMPYRTLDRMADERRGNIKRQSKEFLAGLKSGYD